VNLWAAPQLVKKGGRFLPKKRSKEADAHPLKKKKKKKEKKKKTRKTRERALPLPWKIAFPWEGTDICEVTKEGVPEGRDPANTLETTKGD